MVHLSRFKLLFCAFLIQLSIPTLLFTERFEKKSEEEFELFSLTLGGDDGLKINILEQPVYDQEAENKKAEDIINCDTATAVAGLEINKIDQENNNLDQQIAKTPQKTKILEQETKKAEQEKRKVENNKRLKAARLKKALEEL